MTENEQSKDKMPEFTPPEPNISNGWHCWHEYNQHLKGIREFKCCHCDGKAMYIWVDTCERPEGHGPYRPTSVPTGGGWRFVLDDNTKIFCERGAFFHMRENTFTTSDVRDRGCLCMFLSSGQLATVNPSCPIHGVYAPP
jgi:hypothetical protein